MCSSDLINMAGGESLGLMEANIGANLICDAVDPDAEIIFGTSINEELEDEIVITVIATDFQNKEVNYVVPPTITPQKEVVADTNTTQTIATPEKFEEKISSFPEVEVQIPIFLQRHK